MDIVSKTVVSRRKSIAVIEKEIVEIEAQIAKAGATSPGGVALAQVKQVRVQRLERLKAELAGLEALIPDPRQLEVPGTKSPGKR